MSVSSPSSETICYDAMRTVIVEDFVDDVPSVELALIVASFVGDVVLEDGDQRRVGPRAATDPRRDCNESISMPLR